MILDVNRKYLYDSDKISGKRAAEINHDNFHEPSFDQGWRRGHARGRTFENATVVAPLKLLLWDIDTYLGMLIDRGVPNGGDIASLRERIGKLVPK